MKMPARRYPAMISIARRIAEKHGVTLADIIAPSKAKRLTPIRFEIWATIQVEHPKFSSVQIGSCFDRDHTTILHGIKRWKQMTGDLNMSCRARQYGDQMYCAECQLTWDKNDPELPSCRGGNKTVSSALSRQVGGDHYSKLPLQPLEFSSRNNLSNSLFLAIKYLTRWRDKGGLKDLTKGRHCIELDQLFPGAYIGPNRVFTMQEYVSKNNLPSDTANALYAIEDLYIWGETRRPRALAEIDKLIAAAQSEPTAALSR